MSQSLSAEALTAMKHGTDNIAKEICTRCGYKTPYEIWFKDLDDYQPPTDIFITAGNPVNIIISQTFVYWALMHKKRIIYRHKLASALEHMHYVHRTLRHPVPLDKAIALRKDARNWVKTLAPNLPRDLDKKYLEISYSVTVKDRVSNMELTLHGDDPIEIRDTAISRLSHSVYENADYEELHETLKDISRAKNERVLPSRIRIDADPISVNAKLEY